MSMQNGQNLEKWSSQNFDFDFQFRDTAEFVFQWNAPTHRTLREWVWSGFKWQVEQLGELGTRLLDTVWYRLIL